jgi:hypothetical protein
MSLFNAQQYGWFSSSRIAPYLTRAINTFHLNDLVDLSSLKGKLNLGQMGDTVKKLTNETMEKIK